MKEIPSSEALASMVSTVTQTMFGMSFSLSNSIECKTPWESPWRMAVLPVTGDRPITVAIASDKDGGCALGSAMFSCPTPDVDDTMIDDSLSELVNIVAGQVKTSMGLDQHLGLPRVLKDGGVRSGVGDWKSATLQNEGRRVTVWVAITEAQV